MNTCQNHTISMIARGHMRHVQLNAWRQRAGSIFEDSENENINSIRRTITEVVEKCIWKKKKTKTKKCSINNAKGFYKKQTKK